MIMRFFQTKMYWFGRIMSRDLIKHFLFYLLLFYLNPSYSATYILPEKGNVIGTVQAAYSLPGETLSETGIRFDVGYEEMKLANPAVNPNKILAPHTRLIVPSQYILPPKPHHGIIINLAEYRLYFFPKNENVVLTMPVGIGRKGWETPTGLTRITAKVNNPVWRPSAKLKAANDTIVLPDEFPATANNPLGNKALRLGWTGYLIHGSNQRTGIGRRISAGCIRMLPDDMDELFDMVSVNTPVRVVNMQLKLMINNE